MKPEPWRTRRPVWVIDDFYPDDAAHAISVAATEEFEVGGKYHGYRSKTGYATGEAKCVIEAFTGLKVTGWSSGAGTGNGQFFLSLSRGPHKEDPLVHTDDPPDRLTAVVYLTPGLGPEYGTSFWCHQDTGLVNAPTRGDAKQLGYVGPNSLYNLRQVLKDDASKPDRWFEIQRIPYKFNRAVVFASGMFHSGTKHYGRSRLDGRLHQTFRCDVDWSTLV